MALPRTLAPYAGVIKQFMKFFVTGAIGAVVDFGIYNTLTRVVGWNTVLLIFGQPFIAANLVSVFCAIVSNFLFNKYWTFSDHEGSVTKQWVGYFTLNLITFILNQLLVSFFTFHLPIYQLLFTNQVDNAAKATAIGLILFVNFAGSKLLVFRPKSTTKN